MVSVGGFLLCLFCFLFLFSSRFLLSSCHGTKKLTYSYMRRTFFLPLVFSVSACRHLLNCCIWPGLQFPSQAVQFVFLGFLHLFALIFPAPGHFFSNHCSSAVNSGFVDLFPIFNFDLFYSIVLCLFFLVINTTNT